MLALDVVAASKDSHDQPLCLTVSLIATPCSQRMLDLLEDSFELQATFAHGTVPFTETDQKSTVSKLLVCPCQSILPQKES